MKNDISLLIWISTPLSIENVETETHFEKIYERVDGINLSCKLNYDSHNKKRIFFASNRFILFVLGKKSNQLLNPIWR